MPLFAFECADCHAQTELLVASTGEAQCPSCGSGTVAKLPSAFAPMSGPIASDPAPAACGTANCCMGEGGCALN